jgi:hypothetical protein
MSDGPSIQIGRSYRPLLIFVMTINCALLLNFLAFAWQYEPHLDDAFMFYRYAENLKAGLGISWNPDAVPTYGLTSPLWLFVILPFTYLPLLPKDVLTLTSWLTCVAALAVVFQTLRENTRSSSPYMASAIAATALLPILLSFSFRRQAVSGMDTMLSLLANAFVVLSVLRYAKGPSTQRAYASGAAALFATLVRPENALCAILVPLFHWYQLGSSRSVRHLLGLAALPISGTILFLAINWAYFGTPLPLSFFVKSLNAYTEFLNDENAVRYLFMFLSGMSAYVACSVFAASRRQLRSMCVFLIPVSLTFAYLLTVRHIAGLNGRLYFPFLPYVVVPTVMALDARLLDKKWRALEVGAKALAAFLALILLRPDSILATPMEQAYRRLVLPASVDQPALRNIASEHLPRVPYYTVVRLITDKIVSQLPAGSVVAASEVGYLGATAPKVAVVDLVGLNDAHIGLSGFSMDYLLERRPDLIWFPHTDYVGLRKIMFADARLFSEYTVIDEAFNYGIAVRKASPFRAQVESGVRDAFAFYVGYKLQDYIVNRPFGTD